MGNSFTLGLAEHGWLRSVCGVAGGSGEFRPAVLTAYHRFDHSNLNDLATHG